MTSMLTFQITFKVFWNTYPNGYRHIMQILHQIMTSVNYRQTGLLLIKIIQFIHRHVAIVTWMEKVTIAQCHNSNRTENLYIIFRFMTNMVRNSYTVVFKHVLIQKYNSISFKEVIWQPGIVFCNDSNRTEQKIPSCCYHH